MVIPVPEAESNIPYYDSLYPGEFKMPKQLIHIQPFSLDTEQPDYDLDSDDEAFVLKLKKKMEISLLQFEEMIDRLEKGSGQQSVSLPEAKLLLKEDDELIKEVFEYWSRKRKSSKAQSLIPSVKQEKRDGSSTNDPYVAFRRRTEKMQTRKNRKNDEASYEKMLKLRRDLSRAVTILEMIKRREKSKRELLHLTLEIIEKRNGMADYGGEVMAEVLAERALVRPQIIPLVPLTNQYRHQDHTDLKDYKSKPEKCEVPRQKRKYEKKQKALPLSAGGAHHPSLFNAKDLNQYDFPSSDDEPYSQMLSGSSEAEEENDPDGVYAFRRRAGCQYHAVRQDSLGSWPWCSPSEGSLSQPRFRYSLTSLTVPRRCLGLARRRVGRGGRVLLDRAHSDLDPVYQELSPERQDLPPSPPPPPPVCERVPPLSTDTTPERPLDRHWHTDLTHLLLSIKACRWRHFRPRTLPLSQLDNAHPLFRRMSRRTKPPTTQPAPRSCPRGGRGINQPPVQVLTAEQFQHHQEQLSLMKKQQLEQAQQHHPPLSGVTLDQASAQLAASALVTADQLLALKSKDELPPGGAVNGVLSPSGVYKASHLSSSASPSPAAPAPSPSALLPSSTASTAPHSNNGTAPHSGSAPHSNSIRVGALVPGKRLHSSRTLPSMGPSALKLSHCQKPKAPTPAPTAALSLGPRENHDQEKGTLNSLSENTVAMEVT
ncbi:enhancer of polycomb homolog 1b isoform X2 [Periophthalmus magnuspinnatus]|nr:enhancer of polycomb homolog 1b isoform X2 [Periophthalmus magnuspinnatus]